MSSPVLDPRNVSPRPVAKIDRALMQRQLRGSTPMLERVAVIVAAMAMVMADRHVHRERAATPRLGLMQWTTSVPLDLRPTRGLEPK